MTINKFMLKDGRLFLDGNELNWVEKFSLSADEGDARLTLDMRVDLLSSEEEKQEDRKEISPWISAETPPEKYIDEKDNDNFMPFLVCSDDVMAPFVAWYNGRGWDDLLGSVEKVSCWMSIPEWPRQEG